MTPHTDRHYRAVNHGTGYEDLWAWFELSYASWLTLPRVLMHEMPDRWQAQMASLLTEMSERFPLDMTTRVQRVNRHGGRLTKMPAWIGEYRHPDYDTLHQLYPRAIPGGSTEEKP